MRGLRLAVLSAAALLTATAGELPAASFTPGDLVVVRVGDGSGSLNSSAAATFLDEYTTAGVFVQSIALPTAAGGGNNALTISGGSDFEGGLTRSVDGRFLLLGGYNEAPGTGNVSNTASARVVGVVSAAGAVDTTTTLGGAFLNHEIHSVASTDGSNLWAAGDGNDPTPIGGVVYALRGANTSTLVNAALNKDAHFVSIQGGQLFLSGNPPGGLHLGTVGTGTPTSSAGYTELPPGVGLNNPYGYKFFDLNAGVGYLGTGLDTLYVADASGDILKFVFDGTNWVNKGTIHFTGVHNLDGFASGNTVTLFATNHNGGSSSIKTATDTFGYDLTDVLNIDLNAAPALATAGSQMAFRGITFAPVPEPASVLAAGLVGAAAVWIGRRSRSASRRG